VREELAEHLRLLTEDYARAGLTPGEARRQARLKLGGAAAIEEQYRDEQRLRLFRDLAQDVRYGFRTLVRAPSFTVTAVLVLAVGISANVTVFSLGNALFLRPLPVAEPGSLLRVCSNRYSTTGYRSYLEYRDRNRTLSDLAGFQMRSFAVRVDRENEHTVGETVTGNYFPMLGTVPSRGRLLSDEDDRANAVPVVVLSHRFWTRRFNASPEAVGRTIMLNDRVFTIVGVAPAEFTGLMTPLVGDLWVPVATDALLRGEMDQTARLDSLTLHLMGRLRAGIVRSQAQSDLDTIGRQLHREAGQDGREQAVTVYAATTLHPEIATPAAAFTIVLLAAAGLLLLIVCVNLANLLLARAAGRGLELALRQSLGAGRGRLVRQLLTETLMLSVAGAGAGLAVAWWSTRLLSAVQVPAPVPIAFDLPIDTRVVAFAAVVAVGAALAFGAMPALTASRADLVSALKNTGTDGPRIRRMLSGFVAAQVAMSVLLLIGAALLGRGLVQAQALGLGFETTRVLTASLDLEMRGYTEARGRPLVRSLVERLEAAPGIVSANVVEIVPVTFSNNIGLVLREGDGEPPPGTPPNVYWNSVGPGHFRTLQIALIAGRDFTHFDDDRAPRVAIVNETLARQLWPQGNALGQRLRRPGNPGRTPQIIDVVGVARDSTYVAVGEDVKPFMYIPFAQSYRPQFTLLVRSADGAERARSAIEEAIRAEDPGLVVFNVATMDEATSAPLLPARVAGMFFTVLGAFALALAGLGIYGVLSLVVRSRTREIGVRVALGASPGAVAALVVRRALTWTVVGAAAGLALAALLTRFLTVLLYGTSPTDVGAFAGVTLLVVAVAGAAALVPAVRASRLDPLVAMRIR
jgi:predicted permease